MFLQRSKSQKNDGGVVRSTVREVSPAKSDRSASPDKQQSRSRSRDKEWHSKRDYSDYDQKQASESPDKSPVPPPPASHSPDNAKYSRNNSPPPKAYRDPRSDKFQYVPPIEKVEERRSVKAQDPAPSSTTDDHVRSNYQDNNYRYVRNIEVSTMLPLLRGKLFYLSLLAT